MRKSCATAATQVDNVNRCCENHEDSHPIEDHLTRAITEAIEESKRLDQQAAELGEAAGALRNKMHKTAADSQQAERSEDNASDLRSRSRTTRDLVTRLRFEILLLRLSRSDENLTTVDTGTMLPHSYALDLHNWHKLGSSLRVNSVVTSIELDLSFFQTAIEEEVPSEHYLHENLHNMLGFLRFSSSLRSIHVYNHYEEGFTLQRPTQMLLDAICGNKHVTTLKWLLRASACRFLKMLETGSDNVCKLEIACAEADTYSENEKQLIVSAFAAKTRLESLTICLSSEGGDMQFRLLSALGSLPLLRELELKYRDDSGGRFDERCWDALSQYLSSASSRSLKRLGMVELDYSDSGMTSLLSGLVRHDRGLPTTSLVELSFTGYSIDEGYATNCLVAFLQTRTTNDHGDTIYRSCLRVLCVDAGQDDLADEGRPFCKRVAVALLMATSSKPTKSASNLCREFLSSSSCYHPTVGSQIRFVRFIRVYPVFFHRLCKHADRVQLQTLELCTVSRAVCVSMSKCLAKLSSLQQLSLEDVADGQSHWIVRGLKRNGSICEVSKSQFDATELRLIQGYCRRNQFLGDLIVHPSKEKDNADGPRTAAVCDDNKNAATLTTKASKSKLAMHPGLLQAAMQVPNSGGRTITRGLLALGQECGSRREPAKRSSRSKR